MQQQATVETLIDEQIQAAEAAIQAEQQYLASLKEQRGKVGVQKGLKKWIGYNFQSSSGLTPEFAAFAAAFKKFVQNNAPQGSELKKFNRGHFYCSGFIQRGSKNVYFSLSDVRGWDWSTSILVRTAKDCGDYTGGQNNRANVDNFGQMVDRLLDSTT